MSSTREDTLRCIKDILNEAQEKVQSHPRLINALVKLNVESERNGNIFIDEFLKYVTYFLKVQELGNAHANNVHMFIVKLTIAVQEDQREKKENRNSLSTDGNISFESTGQNEDVVSEFTCRLLDFLVGFNHATETSVRFRACHLAREVLSGMAMEATLDDDQFQRIVKAMLIFLKDKSANVRIEAVHALAKLQDPGDTSCPVVKEYVFHLTNDPNPLVREAISKHIAATMATLVPMVQRTRDIKPFVRKVAYSFLGERVHIRSMSISMRVRLITEGLTDRSDMVREVVEKMLLPSWIKMSSGSIPSFLRYLDVQGSIEAAELALKFFFKNAHPNEITEAFQILNETKLLEEDELSCENVFYWLSLIVHFKELNDSDMEEHLDRIRPDVVTFCNYTKMYVTSYNKEWDLDRKLHHEFVSSSLISIASNYELSDLAARQALERLFNEIISMDNKGHGILKPLVACVIKLHNNPQNCLDFFAEAISNLRQPITVHEIEKTEVQKHKVDIDIAKITVQVNILRDQLKNEVRNQEFGKAQSTKDEIADLEAKKLQYEQLLLPTTQEIRVEKNDPETILKCLILISEMLLQVNLKAISPTLRMMIESLFLPSIQSEDPAVRNRGVLALGLCCMIDKIVACQHIVLLVQISQIDQAVIQMTSLKIIYDLLLLFGLEAFTEDDAMDKTVIGDYVPETPPHGPPRPHRVSNLITLLKAQLHSQFEGVRSLTAKGLGKLVILGRLYSPQILTNLILLWFNPSTEDELVQFLGVFLQCLPSSGENGKKTLEECFVPCLTTVMDAPKSSPLSKIDPVQMGKFLLQLMSPKLDCTKSNIEETNPHDRISERILLEICRDKEPLSCRDWSRLLPFCLLSTKCLPVHKQMVGLVDRLIKNNRDKLTVKYLQKFKEILTNMTGGSESGSLSSYDIENITPNSRDAENPPSYLSKKTRHHLPDLTSTVLSETLNSANISNPRPKHWKPQDCNSQSSSLPSSFTADGDNEESPDFMTQSAKELESTITHSSLNKDFSSSDGFQESGNTESETHAVTRMSAISSSAVKRSVINQPQESAKKKFAKRK